jgi:hypothetical protein
MSIRFGGKSSGRISCLLRRRSLFSVGVGALAAGLALKCAPHASSSCIGYLRRTLVHVARHPGQPVVWQGFQLRSLSTLFSLDNTPMASLTPPQPAIAWNHSASDVTALTEELITKDRKFLDAITALPHKDCTFESVSHLLSIWVVISIYNSGNIFRYSLSNFF